MEDDNVVEDAPQEMGEPSIDKISEIPDLTKEGIVKFLKERKDKKFVWIDESLIALKQGSPPTYSAADAAKYKIGVKSDGQPNLYQLGQNVMEKVLSEGRNANILICGDSKSGKSAQIQPLCEYIFGAVSSNSSALKERLFDAIALLQIATCDYRASYDAMESDQFGYSIKIALNPKGEPVGAKIFPYHSPLAFSKLKKGDRSFKLFYQFLEGASGNQRIDYSLMSPDSYMCLSQTGCVSVEGIDDTNEYLNKTKFLLEKFDITPDSCEEFFHAIAAILTVANVGFESDDDGFHVEDEEEIMEFVAFLLYLEDWKVARDFYQKNCKTAAEAQRLLEILAGSLYYALVNYFCDKLNEKLDEDGKVDSMGLHVSLTMVGGYQVYEGGANDINELIRHSLTERMNIYRIQRTFQDIQDEFLKCGVSWDVVEPEEKYNAKSVCALLDRILSTCEASCGEPKQFIASIEDSEIISRQDTLFAVRQNNGVFCEYANDSLRYVADCKKFTEPILDFLSSVNFKFMHEILLKVAGSKRICSLTALLTSMDSLLRAEKASRSYCIFCIIGEDETYDGKLMEQTSCFNFYEMAEIGKQRFYFTSPNEPFFLKYRSLDVQAFRSNIHHVDYEVIIPQILRALGPEFEAQWQVTKDLTFIKDKITFIKLQEELKKKYTMACIKVQKCFREYKWRTFSHDCRVLVNVRFKGNKERRRRSLNCRWLGDYVNASSEEYRDIFDNLKDGTRVAFADIVKIYDKKVKSTERLVLLTKTQFLIYDAKKKALLREIMIKDINTVSMSKLCDDFLVVSVPEETDVLLESQRKTEMVGILMKGSRELTRTDMKPVFSNNIVANVEKKKPVKLSFVQDDSVSMLDGYSRSKTNVKVCIGLPADSLPKFMTNGGEAVKEAPKLVFNTASRLMQRHGAGIQRRHTFVGTKTTPLTESEPRKSSVPDEEDANGKNGVKAAPSTSAGNGNGSANGGIGDYRGSATKSTPVLPTTAAPAVPSVPSVAAPSVPTKAAPAVPSPQKPTIPQIPAISKPRSSSSNFPAGMGAPYAPRPVSPTVPKVPRPAFPTSDRPQVPTVPTAKRPVLPQVPVVPQVAHPSPLARPQIPTTGRQAVPTVPVVPTGPRPTVPTAQRPAIPSAVRPQIPTAGRPMVPAVPGVPVVPRPGSPSVPIVPTIPTSSRPTSRPAVPTVPVVPTVPAGRPPLVTSPRSGIPSSTPPSIPTPHPPTTNPPPGSPPKRIVVAKKKKVLVKKKKASVKRKILVTKPSH